MIPKGKSGEDIPEELQKKILLEILDLIMERCDKLGLKCMLTWGTLLGAARHKGFIPWDDDVDVMMTRDEYEIFKGDVLKKPLADNVVFTDPDHPISRFNPYRVGKIGRSDTVIHYDGYGREFELILSIDVFPLDIVPPPEKEFWEYANESAAIVQEINRIIYLPNKDKGAVHYALSLLRKKFSYYKDYKRLLKKRGEIALRFKGKDTGYVGTPDNFDGIGVPFPSGVVADVVKLEFEGKMYNAPVGYDTLLRLTYGDYMQLPPVEQRVSRHDYADTRWR